MAVVMAGWLATVCGIVVGLPQMLRLLRRGHVAGLSLLSWQAMVVVNLTWAAHGLTIGQFPLILTNVVGLLWSASIVVLVARHLHRSLSGVFLPPLLVCGALVVCDQVFGSAAFGLAAVVPALVAALGQSAQLVRAPSISGVSGPFLALAVLNQAFWLTWAVLVADAGTTIIAASTGTLAAFNLTCWAFRSARLLARDTVGRMPDASTADAAALLSAAATRTTPWRAQMPNERSRSGD